MKSPYHTTLVAIAEGKSIEWHSLDIPAEWVVQDSAQVLRDIACRRYVPECYRVEPEIININGFKVAGPLREAPAVGSMYYVAKLWVLGDDDFYHGPYQWAGDQADGFTLAAGIVHTTAQAAKDHSEALLSFTKVTA